MRMDQLLNRFVIRKQIEENGSNLRPIPMGVVEQIDARRLIGGNQAVGIDHPLAVAPLGTRFT